MIVVVDQRQGVVDAFVSMIGHQGIAASGFVAEEFRGWISAAAEQDLSAVEAFLVGECTERIAQCRAISQRTRAPVIVMSESRSLDETLDLFGAGVADVVRKPVHIKEILARINAVGRRAKATIEHRNVGDIRIFFDGRDPEVAGVAIALPRRERRILEYLGSNTGCRVTKSQIFNAVYGLFNEDIDVNVIESHLSKLRKRLREHLGYDPIDSKRFLGYRLVMRPAGDREASPAQDRSWQIEQQFQFAQE